MSLIDALLSPECYPHATTEIHLIETHISWVLLTGEFAYKIKKPVNFGFLDFSSLQRRKYCCEEELRLNSRFSTDLYLEVVAITGSERSPKIAGAGAALEYAVKMRQFDQEVLLEALATRNALTHDDMHALARVLAEFHLQCAARLPADEKNLGSLESITQPVMENFRQIAPRLDSADAQQSLRQLRDWSEQRSQALQTTLAQRRADGFVRECHGDLHLRNIARIDGVMVFFDCIEFNPQLSWIDVQSELAFLLMDMEYRQLPQLSNRLLNSYLEYIGDYAGLAVLNYYKVYRAMVRAKVLVLKRESDAATGEAERQLRDEYDAYVQLAQSYQRPPQPFLAIMHGVSGTGKSTVAATLASAMGAIRIRADVERKRLFGLAPDARSDEAAKQQLYGKEASARTFATLAAIAEQVLTLGYPVFVDATFIAMKWRDMFAQLAEKLQMRFVIIDCRASEATIEKRLNLREQTRHDASEAGVEVMRRQLEAVESFSDHEKEHVIVIDTEQPVSADPLKMYLTN